MNKPFQYLYDICLILRVLNSCCALLHVMSRSYERHNVLLWTSYCALMNFILCSYERHVVLLWTSYCALMNAMLCSYERHVVLLWTPRCALMNINAIQWHIRRLIVWHDITILWKKLNLCIDYRSLNIIMYPILELSRVTFKLPLPSKVTRWSLQL